MSPKREILYVLSDVRSGSTLLDQLLGAHPDIVSVGEMHWLRAYLRDDRRLYDPAHPLICACGAPVPECSFWNSVEEVAGRSLDSYRLHPRFFGWRSTKDVGQGVAGRLKWLPVHFIRRTPDLYKNPMVHRLYGGPGLAKDNIALAKAILTVTGKRIMVDSSKSALKFWSVYNEQPQIVRAVVLVRDYRAVVFSKMKRGQGLEDAARGWREKMIQIEALTQGIPDNRCFRMKYESLCTDPARELTSLCSFLGVDFDAGMLNRPTENIHHIGGSPSKFDPSKRSISLDTRYQQAFDPGSLDLMRQIVGDVATSLGY